MPRVILFHIGRHKSGTSSLQHFLGARRDYLDGLGILYPRTGTANRIAHHALVEACNVKLGDASALLELIEGLKAELKPHHDMVMFSSEAFQNLNDLSRVKEIVTALEADEVRVICYVREHIDYAISGYRQMVHNQRRFVTFDAYARHFADPARFLALWEAIGDLSLKWYDRSGLKNGDIIADFCEQAGFEPGEIPDGDMNPSIGGNLLVHKLAANKLDLPAPTYTVLRNLAARHAPFRAAFRVSDPAAAALRATSTYNATLFALLGEPKLKSWASEAALPETGTLKDDLEQILSQPLPRNVTAPGPDDRARLLAAMSDAAPWFELVE